MRFYVLSDLHLEFAPFTPPPVETDAVILAGDIHTGHHGVRWALATFPNVPVIYVLGNHEFYNQKLQKLLAQLHEETQGTNVHLLENEVLQLGEVVILGATLWTDFALHGNPVVAEVTAQTGMNDFRRIRTLPQYRRLKAAETRGLHQASLRWLGEQISTRKGNKIVVVTHHAPSWQSVPACFEGDLLNPAFASDLSQFILEHQPTPLGAWPYSQRLRLRDRKNTRDRQPKRLSLRIANGL